MNFPSFSKAIFTALVILTISILGNAAETAQKSSTSIQKSDDGITGTDSSVGLVAIPNIQTGRYRFTGRSYPGSPSQSKINIYGQSIGIGIIPQIGLGSTTAIEMGLSYIPRTLEDAGVVLNLPSAQVTPLFKFEPLSHLVFGVGGFVSYGFGDTKLSDSRMSRAASYKDAGLKSLDYGPAIAAGSYFNLASNLQFTGDCTYQYGIPKIASSSSLAGDSTLSLSALQARVGIRVGI